MGIIYEAAVLPRGGPPGDEVEALLRESGALGVVTSAAFSTDLDKPASLPPPTEMDRVVVLGIGGSALGARAIHESCGEGARKPLVIVDNVDPASLEAAWCGGDPARTAWVAVSKSGSTTETLSQVGVVRERLKSAGVWQAATIVTGASGPLRDLARADDLAVFEVPEEVGGRFSVFTPAATVALALVGHDVAGLLEGAKAARDHCASGDSVSARLASLLVASERAGRNVVSLWCYAERLETVGEWFRQLWAESLGKRRADGSSVGQTPLVCVGSTDQHSVQQLMVEGPPDKTVLVFCGPVSSDTPVPDDALGVGAGHGLGEILEAMRRATTSEMVAAGCPAATIRLDDWSERTVGALLMTCMCATVQAGALLGVDPYGQPGVEAAKIATKELLADPGGKRDGAISNLLGEGGGIRCG